MAAQKRVPMESLVPAVLLGTRDILKFRRGCRQMHALGMHPQIDGKKYIEHILQACKHCFYLEKRKVQ
jgi:hypothetical protein